MDNPNPLPRPNLFEGQPAPPTPQQARSRQKRAALLEAGLSSFAEKGFEATTIEDIVHAAGVAVGGFYQYFRSKQQLLLVLMDNLLAELETLEFTALDGSSYAAVIREFLGRAMTTDLQYAGAYRAWREAVLVTPELRALDDHIQAWTTHRVTLLLNSLAALPGARQDIDIPATAWLLNVLFWELTQRLTADTLDSTLDATADMIAHTLFADAR